MQIPTRSRVAVTAMLDVALHGGSKPVPLVRISARQQVSQSCLENIFSRLRNRGLVVSVHGPGGGYRLGRSPDRISVADIIDAVDQEVFDCRACNGVNRDHMIESCITNGLWCRVSDAMYGHLRSVTLESILATVGASPAVSSQSVRTAPMEFESGGKRLSPQCP